MKYFLLLALGIAGCTVSVHSQSIKGKLLDLVDNKPLAGASLTLTSLKDSTQIKYGLADSTGSFVFQDLPIDSFFFKVSFTGYEPYRQIVATNDSTPVVDLATLFIPKSTVQLNDVTVTARTPPTQQKGDTIQYNASQFKVNPDATVEDLVKKAPGITVDRDGTVTAQGEQVRKVTIDGRDFFGDDASAALRNLPADVVDKIQVFDRLSDQAQLTGVDDGNSQRAINIVTRAGMRNGQFGRVFAGYGTDERYQAGGNMSFFKENRRISLVGLSNNINQQNFASQDLLGVTSNSGGGNRGRGNFGGGGGGNPRGGGGGGNFGGGGGQNFTIGQQSGISRTNAIGINYSDKWGQKMDVSGSYFFNNSNLNNDRFTNRQSLAKPDSILFSDENALSRSNNYNHRVNFRMEYRIDSNNMLIISPSLSFQKNKSVSNTFAQNYYDLTTGLLTRTINDFNSINSGYNFNNNITYRHAFAKRGRSISLNLNTSLNKRDGDSYQESAITDFADGGQSDTLLQYYNNRTTGRTISTNIIYTEPIGQKGQLQFNYNPSFTKNTADKQNYQFDEFSGKYSDFDTTLSNKFDNTYNTHNGGVTYRIGDRDNQFSAGLSYQHSSLESEQLFPEVTSIDRTFSNILGNIQLRRKISTRSSIRLFYRGGVSAPSVNQLQNVIDNSNILYFTTGNPDLNQQYQHTLSARYTFTNTQLGQSLFANVFVQKTSDYITNAVFTAINGDSLIAPGIVLNEGSQLSKPVNLDGYWSLRSFFTFGQPLKALKVNINVNAGFTYSKTPGISNNLETMTNTYNYSTGAVVASNVSEYIDFNLSYTANFNRVRNSDRPQLNSNYITQTAGIQFNLLSKKGWFLQNDLNNQSYSGLTEGYNQSFWLWNASIGKKLLKKKQGELKLSVFDLLKQNQSIIRTVNGFEITDERNTVLQQYFMLTFTYSLKNFGTAAVRRGGGGQGGGERRFNPGY
jgi:uncharacterized membrane protein YgcG